MEGDGVFSFGGTNIPVRNAKVNLGQSRIGDGNVWTFAIEDERWRWAYGEISGHYNIREANGSIRRGTEKSLRELAVLCLKAMKESQYNVNKLNNEDRPRVDWSWSNPAQSLASLADGLGCRVVKKLDGTVEIVEAGVGRDLPELPVMSLDLSYESGAIPSAVQVVGGVALLQGRWKLEAVGIDTTGKIKLPEELSYLPAGGWSGQSPGILSGVKSNDSDSRTDPRKLALDSVFRFYRIKEFVGPKQVPNLVKFKGRDDVLPIQQGLVEIYEAAADERSKQKPAVVRGTFSSGDPGADDVENGTFKGKFSINGELGIVQFDEPMYRKRQGGGFDFADLTLEVAFPVKLETGEPFRGTWRFPVQPRSDVGDYPLRKEDILLTARLQYSSDGSPTSWVTNERDDKLQAQAEHAASIYVVGLSPVTAGSRQYPGLVEIEPDGAIAQVSWQIGGGGFTQTRASRNSEHDTDIYPPYRARRRAEKGSELERKIEASGIGRLE